LRSLREVSESERQFNRVEQVTAKLAVRNHFFQVAVRCGDQTHIHFARMRASQASNSRSCERVAVSAEFQWGCPLLRPGRACPGRLDPIARFFLRNGSGERALFVPKQFALQQARGDCGTIKFHKGTVLTSAAVVNCARNELLARSGLAQQQNRGIARSDGVHKLQNMF